MLIYVSCGSYVVIILLYIFKTGTSAQFCSGINDANKGVQLSYLNDDSDEWIQIAYFSDTIYFAVSNIVIIIIKVKTLTYLKAKYLS